MGSVERGNYNHDVLYKEKIAFNKGKDHIKGLNWCFKKNPLSHFAKTHQCSSMHKGNL